MKKPHDNNYNPVKHTLLVENYCRNPSKRKAMKHIWCYTTNPKKRWDYCDPMSDWRAARPATAATTTATAGATDTTMSVEKDYTYTERSIILVYVQYKMKLITQEVFMT